MLVVVGKLKLIKLLQHVTDPPDSQKNYLVVDQKTETSTIEAAFEQFTSKRKDIGILLINQHVSPVLDFSPNLGSGQLCSYTTPLDGIQTLPSSVMSNVDEVVMKDTY